MTAMFKTAYPWKLIACAAELVAEALATKDPVASEEMEQLFRKLVVPSAAQESEVIEREAQRVPEDVSNGAEAPKQVVDEDTHARPAPSAETDGGNGLFALAGSEKRLLRAIEKDPNLPTGNLRVAAKIDAGKFAGVRDGLVTKGLVVVEVLEGKGHKKVCRLTPAGEDRVKALLAEQRQESSPAPTDKTVAATGAGDHNGVAPALVGKSDPESAEIGSVKEAEGLAVAFPVVSAPVPVRVVTPVDPRDGLQSPVSRHQLKEDLDFLRAVDETDSATFSYVKGKTGFRGGRFVQVKDRLVLQGSIVVDEEILPGGKGSEKIIKTTSMGRGRHKELEEQSQAAVAKT